LQTAIQQSGVDAHFLDRHGPDITDAQLHIRSTTGISPDYKPGMKIPKNPRDSTAFTDYVDMKAAIDRALEMYARGETTPGGNVVSFDMGRPIGSGFVKGGGSYASTSQVKAYFRDGKLVTIFPQLGGSL
jgi:hypothetical protein